MRKFKKYIFRFKQTTRAIRTIEEGNNEIDSLQREVEELKDNVKKVESKQDDIVIMLQQTQFMLQSLIENKQKWLDLFINGYFLRSYQETPLSKKIKTNQTRRDLRTQIIHI